MSRIFHQNSIRPYNRKHGWNSDGARHVYITQYWRCVRSSPWCFGGAEYKVQSRNAKIKFRYVQCSCLSRKPGDHCKWPLQPPTTCIDKRTTTPTTWYFILVSTSSLSTSVQDSTNSELEPNAKTFYAVPSSIILSTGVKQKLEIVPPRPER